MLHVLRFRRFSDRLPRYPWQNLVDGFLDSFLVMKSHEPIHSTSAFRAATFLRGIAEGLIAVALPFQAIKLGAGPAQLGTLGSLTTASYTACCLTFARLIGRIPMRGTVLLALLFLSALAVGIAYAHSLVLLYVLAVFSGIATSLFWPQIMTWLANHVENRGMTRQFGAFNLSWCAGFPVGLAAGGYLFEADMRLPYFIAAAVTIAAATTLWLFTGSRRTAIGQKLDPEEMSSAVSDARARTFLLIAWLSMFSTYFVSGNFRYQLPKLTKSVGMGEGTFGVLIFLVYGAQLLTFLLLMRTERWHFKAGLLWSAQLFVALAALLVYLSVKPLALGTAFVLAGVGLGVTYFSSQYYGIRSPLGRGRRAAIHEALIGSGYLAGAYCGGQLAQTYSLRTPYIGSVAVLVALLAVQIVLDRCRRTRE